MDDLSDEGTGTDAALGVPPPNTPQWQGTRPLFRQEAPSPAGMLLPPQTVPSAFCLF